MKFNLILFLVLFFNKNCSAEQLVLSLNSRSEIPFGEIKPESFNLQYGDTMNIIYNKYILGEDSSLLVYKVDSNLCLHSFYDIDENNETCTIKFTFNLEDKFFIKSVKDEEFPLWLGVIVFIVFLIILFTASELV